MSTPLSRTIENLPAQLADGDYIATTEDQQPNYLRGFIAGAIGGLVGTAIKDLVEGLELGESDQDVSPEQQAAEEIADQLPGDYELNDGIAAQSIHWAFGTLIGGVYGMACEGMPQLQKDNGASFGTGLYTSTHSTTLPALNLKDPEDTTSMRKTNKWFGHLAFGVAVETVRRGLRNLMEEQNVL